MFESPIRDHNHPLADCAKRLYCLRFPSNSLNTTTRVMLSYRDLLMPLSMSMRRRSPTFAELRLTMLARRGHLWLATTVVAGTTSNINSGVANMILELGNVSVETKGLVSGDSFENVQGTIRPYKPS